MRVLYVTAEAYPLAKTGGLADVSRGLAAALLGKGADIRVVMPAYPQALARLRGGKVVATIPPLMGVEDGIIVSGLFPDCDVPVLLVYSATLFGRAGGLYQDDDGCDWPDNAKRFAYFSRVAANIALDDREKSWRPDVVHANDWHAGLVPYLISQQWGPRPRTVFTTHNMAFQGLFRSQDAPIDALEDESGIEFFGQLSYLKAGLTYADRITTVSPTYAREILTPDYGFGLEGVVKTRGGDFCGILNGIDDTLWNPATDPQIAANYHAGDMAGKRLCKRALQHELGFALRAETPLIGFVSRLTQQKMADTLADILPWIAEQGAQLVIVGEGDRAIEASLQNAAANLEGTVSLTLGYDEKLAHKLQAGCDILLAPARFEPCGLTQLYALRYGTLPVVRRTGGLADTVIDANEFTLHDRRANGFVFDEATAACMIQAVSRALALYREPLQWRLLQVQAMSGAYGWDTSAAAYMALYEDVTGIAPDGAKNTGGDMEQPARRAAG